MATSSFNLISTIQNYSVTMNQIFGLGSIEYPKLRIPLIFEFNPLREIPSWELTGIKGKLYLNNFEFAQTVSLHPFRIWKSPNKYHWTLEFPLTLAVIEKIERERHENVKFQLQLEMSFNLYSMFPKFPEASDNSFYLSSSTSAESSIELEIEHSYWLKNVLPRFGYKSIRLIELPGNNLIIPEAYQKSLDALDSALDYFKKGDYDGAVGKCRIAIEGVRKDFDKIKKSMGKESEKDWLKRLTSSTEEWLAKITLETYSFTSKPHHSTISGHFNRQDSEAIIMVTTAILSFSGNVGKSDLINAK